MLNVRLYFNTGYDLVNVPYNPSMLDNETYRDVPAVDLLQGKYIDALTIKTTYADQNSSLDLLDYVRIGGYDETQQSRTLKYTYYAVLKVEMLSVDTARLYLAEDVISTAGGAEYIEICGGIISRRSKPNNVYSQSSFLDDELLGCAEPLLVEWNIVSKGGDTVFNLVESTIDLEQGPEAETVSDGTYSVTVPVMKEAQYTTIYRMQGAFSSSSYKNIPNPTGAAIYVEVYAPGTGTPTLGIYENIAKARSLGIENGIISQYAIPIAFAIYDAPSHTLTGKSDNIDSLLDIIPSDVDTNKVYRCIFAGDKSRFALLTAAGDTVVYDAEDIANIGHSGQADFTNNVFIKRVVDPRPGGRPYYRFQHVNCDDGVASGSLDISNDLMFSVKGAQWNNVPIKFTQVSGSNIIEQEFHNGRFVTDRQYAGTKAQLANAMSAARFNEGFTALTKGAKFGIDTAQNIGKLAGGMLEPSIAAGALSSEMTSALDLIGSQARNMAITNAADIAQTTTMGVYEATKLKEYYSYGVKTQTIAPEVWFSGDVNTMRDAMGNGCLVFRYKPTANDLSRLTKILKMFGEKTYIAIDKQQPLLTGVGGYYFSYIKVDGAQISKAQGGIVGQSGATTLYSAGLNSVERERLATQLATGVRIWKQATPKNYQSNYTDYLNLSAAT